MVFPLQKKQEVESEEKSEKSSFLTEIQPICIIEGAGTASAAIPFWRGVSIHVISVLHISFFALLPVSVAGWWLLNWRGHGRLAQGFLLVVSLAFYGKGNLAFLPLLLGSILFNFLVGKAMGALPRARKPLLVLGLLGNLGLLGYFKYANFFLDNLNWLLGTSIGALSLLLPLGISFFTFQQIAFLVDRYRGDPADYTLLEYACFVSFFPV